MSTSLKLTTFNLPYILNLY